MAQQLTVALLVALSALYCAWVLMPRRWRQGLAQWLLRCPPLRGLPLLQRAARGGSACGCDGCDAPPPAKVAPITVHRRPPG